MSVKISVVIPTYQRPAMLQRCLNALLTQDYDPAAFEIVVVDDAGSEDTRAVVESYTLPFDLTEVATIPEHLLEQTDPFNRVEVQTKLTFTLKTSVPQIRYLTVEGQHGPAAARNVGWRAARGDVIAFTDDDCIPQPAWLSSGAALMEQGFDGVSGQVIVPLRNLPTDYEKEQLGLERSDFITANCFYRKCALDEVGGFDERFRMAWREDSDLYFTLVERGYQLIRSQDPVVLHPVRPAPWGVSLRMQKKTYFNALCYKKHPRMYSEKFKLHAPGYYYEILGSVLLASFGLATLDINILVPGVLSYLLLVVGFTIRRLDGTSHSPEHINEMFLTSLVIPFLSLYWRLRGAIHFRVLYF